MMVIRKVSGLFKFFFYVEGNILETLYVRTILEPITVAEKLAIYCLFLRRY